MEMEPIATGSEHLDSSFDAGHVLSKLAADRGSVLDARTELQALERELANEQRALQHQQTQYVVYYPL